MKDIFYLFFIVLILSPAQATVVVDTILPNEYGTFGVKIIGEGTDEVIVSIPQCIGGLGIKVEDGNKYTIKTNPDCSFEALYKPLPAEQ